MWLIEFNRDALAWTNKDDVNKHFLKTMFTFFKDKIEHFGYLYLNDIYETLGVCWNPNEGNLCFRKEHNLEFEVVQLGAIEDLNYLIKIRYTELEAL